jgi:UDP:flavonoid glycosyltransferase YjiC (YdhE family)
VFDWVDQWAVLASADVFMTHHGATSTHEAIARGVPMISCPFLWDQPGLAKRCQEFGLSVPLTWTLGEPITAEIIGAALDRVQGEMPSLRTCLEQAREWERQTIAGRGEIVRQLVELV